MTTTQIAQAIGVSRVMVWHWREADRWDDELRRLSSAEYERIHAQAVRNRIATLRDLMDALRTQAQALAERAEEAQGVPLMSLVKMIEVIAELIAREEARLAGEGRREGPAEGQVEVEWQA
jgi:hypothetical protein